MKTEIRTFKPGDYCRFTPEEIPSIIALLKANGWEVSSHKEWTLENVQDCICILVQSNLTFTPNQDIRSNELSRHDFMVTALRLNEGDGLRADMSTPEQRRHISEELEKLGVNQFVPNSDRLPMEYDLCFYLDSEEWLTSSLEEGCVKNHVPYSEWCKRLNETPINHIPDVGKKVEEKTIHNYQMDYAESARAIHIYLKEFCDESLSFPNMIADASRKASEEIERLRNNQTLTLPDGTTVDLSRPIQGLIDGTWYDVSKYIGMSTENEFVCEIHDVFDTPFTEFKHIRNKPDPEFKAGDKVWYKHEIIENWEFGIIDDDGDVSYPVSKSKISGKVEIRPAFIDGKPVYPPFNN